MPDAYTHYEQEFHEGEVPDIDVGDIIVFRLVNGRVIRFVDSSYDSPF